MTLGLAFWILVIVAILFGAGLAWPRTPEGRYAFGSQLLWWALFVLLGWATFGPPLRA
jgi:hypothetical protein